MTTLQNLYANRATILSWIAALMVSWTAIASVIAARVARPAPTSPIWQRALYDLFVDTPAWWAALGRAGIFGGRFNLPGIASRRPADNPLPSQEMPTLPPAPAKEIKLPPIRPGVLLPFVLAAGMGAAGCAHLPTPSPSTQQYDLAFGQCMARAGIQDVTGLGTKILQILDTPGLTQTEITQRIEALGIPAAGQAINAVALCAVSSWVGVHPIAAAAKPTPAQGAVRVFRARHDEGPLLQPGVAR